MKRSKVLIMAICAALTMGIVPAGAHFAESRINPFDVSDRSVKKNQEIVFFGKLRNRHRKCRAEEEVELVRRRTGVVDVDITDDEGEFRFKQDPQPNRGRYFARYRGKGRFGYGDQHRCSRAVSEVIRIRRQR